ncbi:MAG: polysaccharide deacetylase family protein [Phyllobacteriaceae bacterium]|nr:polysaccharide deacetylase family protein [Phyllobacteriaceae bacterium]
MKYAAIRAGLELVALTGAGRLFPAAAGRGVVFTLHHVRPRREQGFAPNGHLSVTPEFLADAAETALAEGLVPVVLEDLPVVLADRTDSRRFVCFTFDDGYRNNAEHALPVLRRYGIPATIFITAGFVERTRSMWWETAEALSLLPTPLSIDLGDGPMNLPLQSKADRINAFVRIARFVATAEEDHAVDVIDAAARARGVDPLAIVDRLVMSATELRTLAADPLVRFGAHTLSHVNLRRIGEERLVRELKCSADAVERYVGYRPRAFAYPYGFPGAVGEREERAAANAGFEVAVTTQPGMLCPAALKNVTALKRVSLNGYYQKPRYVRSLISGLPFKFA